MSSPKAASRAAAPKAAASLAAMLSPARAEASRTNGAKSKGPKTAEGKARSAQNALKHGLRAQKHVVLPGESAAEFAALEAALIEELAPEGALQAVLAQRVVAAAWRLQRAERIEAEIFAREMKGPFGDGDLGLALIRDCNGARSLRHAAALSRRHPRRALARAAHPQGAPGRAGSAGSRAPFRSHRANNRSNPKPAQILAKPCPRPPRTDPGSSLRPSPMPPFVAQSTSIHRHARDRA